MTDHDHMQRAREFYAAAYSDLGVDIPPSVWTVTFETSATLRAIAAALRSQGEAAQVSDVTRQLIERDHRGAAKYGTTLDRTDLSLPDWLQHMAEELMDAAGYALAAKRTAEAARAVPGWQLVPVEPTDDMAIAFAEQWYSKRRAIDDCELEDAYRAMLAAAPKPEGR